MSDTAPKVLMWEDRRIEDLSHEELLEAFRWVAEENAKLTERILGRNMYRRTS